MQESSATATQMASIEYPWGAGVAGGFIGGLGMGVIFHIGANMMPFVGALYGWPTVLGGWVAHMINSVLIGLIFVFLVSRPVVVEQMSTLTGAVGAGVVYSVAVGLVTTGIMLPIATNALGTESIPDSLFPLPGVIGGVLVVVSVGVAHLVYGVLLGVTYRAVHDRMSGRY